MQFTCMPTRGHETHIPVGMFEECGAFAFTPRCSTNGGSSSAQSPRRPHGRTVLKNLPHKLGVYHKLFCFSTTFGTRSRSFLVKPTRTRNTTVSKPSNLTSFPSENHTAAANGMERFLPNCQNRTRLAPWRRALTALWNTRLPRDSV